MLRVCVIGMGHIGHRHCRIYKQEPLVELVGVCDKRIDRAQSASETYSVPYFLDAQEMLNTLKPDLVSVCTGGYEYCSDHYEPTMQALNAGCHVLTEKPIADTIERAREMVETAEKNHRCFALDFNHRFTDAGRQAKKWQEEGRLGDLLFCNMALWIGKPEDYPSPYYHLKALNPHSIDIIRYFMGDIEAVQCFAMKSPGRTIWSTSSMNFKFRNGCVGHLTSSYDIKRGHPMERCEVAGLKGRIVFEDMWRRSTLYPAGDNVILQYNNPVFDGPDRYNVFEDTFKDRIHHFVEQVARGDSPEMIDGTGRDGLEAQKVIREPEALSSYGLDAPRRIVTVEGQPADDESASSVTLLLGDEVDSSCYVMVEGEEDTVYTISSDLFEKTDCTLLQLGQPEQLPALKEENVEAVELSQNGQTVSLTKATRTETIETGETDEEGNPETEEVTEYTWSLDGTELPQDSQAVDDLVSALAQLNFTECLAYKSAQEELEAMGLAGTGTLTLTVTYGDGQTLSLLCGALTGEDSDIVYAMQEGSDMVHALSASVEETLSGLLQADWTAVPDSED